MSPSVLGLLTIVLLFCWWLCRQLRRARLERLEREARAFWSRLPLERKQVFLAMRGLLQERAACDERVAELLFASHLKVAAGSGDPAALQVHRERTVEELILAVDGDAMVPAHKLGYWVQRS